jgi:hypothetical protein
MTPKEKDLVLAQINHQETDLIPYTLDFEGDVAERLDTYYGSDTWRNLVDSAIHEVPGPNLGIEETDDPYYTDLYGTMWRVDCRLFRLVEPALKTPSLEGFSFPDVDALFEQAWDREEAQRTIEQQSDHFLVGGFGFDLFERTCAAWLQGQQPLRIKTQVRRQDHILGWAGVAIHYSFRYSGRDQT